MTKVFQSAGPFSSVLHFAAYKSVGESEEKPLLYYQNNLTSLTTLLEVMMENKVHDLIFSSSCTVYGQPDHVPVDENAPFKRAESAYGATKQMCERILEDVSRTGYKNCFITILQSDWRASFCFDRRNSIGRPNNLVPYITQTAAGIREKLTVFGNDYDTPDGTCVRDFIHVVDLGHAHVKAMEYLASKNGKKIV